MLLMAALSVVGVVNAKAIEIVSAEKSSVSNEQNHTSFLLKDYDWVTVTTGCGKVFYLDNNMYGDCYECLQEDARQFTDAQCGEGYGFELPF